jgi:hypothetical protein
LRQLILVGICLAGAGNCGELSRIPSDADARFRDANGIEAGSRPLAVVLLPVRTVALFGCNRAGFCNELAPPGSAAARFFRASAHIELLRPNYP